MTGKHWSKEKVDWLRKVYPNEGAAGFHNLFPNYTLGSIHQKAFRLGIKCSNLSGLRLKGIIRAWKNGEHRKERAKRLGYLSKKRWENFEIRKKMVDGMRDSWENPICRNIRKKKLSIYARNRSEEHVRKLVQAKYNEPNGFESNIQQYLNHNWKYVGDGSVILNGHCPDFMNVNGKKQVILAHGIYWHSKKDGVTKKQAERADRKPYNELGYEVLFIWEDEWKALKTDEQKRVFIDSLVM